MKEMTVRTEQTLIRNENNRLQELLQTAVGHFRSGEDTAGLDSFLSAMEELDVVIEADRKSRQPQINLDQLLPAVRGLYFYMQNQDITGITDLLEYTVYPLTKEWLKGCDGR
jgi:hypothetical protein